MLESLLLVLALSLDAFAASIAYGANRIRIPLSSILIINSICTMFLAITILIGSFIKTAIPGDMLSVLSFIMLILLGVYYMFEGFVKTVLSKSTNSNRRLNLKVFDLRFIIEVYVDETKADYNYSKHLSPKEALYLAMVLSLDSIGAGLGSGLVDINWVQVLVFSLIFGLAAIWSGLIVGRKLSKKIDMELSWLSGLILIVLAFMKIFSINF